MRRCAFMKNREMAAFVYQTGPRPWYNSQPAGTHNRRETPA
jgi:hypothetical protein